MRMKMIHLKLFTSRLDELGRFYTEVLELPRLDRTEESISFRLGRSRMTFAYRPETTPYHFAFNIPHNQTREALAWARERVDILPYEGEEVVDFSAWDAEAFYFYDPDRNVVEFIARRALSHASERSFSGESLLEISEIGLPSEDIEAVFRPLNRQTGVPIFSGSFDSFCAVGNERGLFICVDTRKKDIWFPTEDKIQNSDFELDFVEGEENYHLAYEKGRLMISN